MLRDIPEGCDVVIDATKCNSIHQDIIEIIRDFKINAKTKKIKLTIQGLKV